MKLDQLVRNILERAIEDGLVAPMEIAERPDFDPDPQVRTDEELRGCVAVLKRSPSQTSPLLSSTR